MLLLLNNNTKVYRMIYTYKIFVVRKTDEACLREVERAF